jgi:hypothetical protein
LNHAHSPVTSAFFNDLLEVRRRAPIGAGRYAN